ncbi:hypothetical protein NEOLEDRAFT_1128211 [Neolentinus lepideus HHB14362 ss-1]|uniref:RGS domain-containing protein n=1 Tax=Neolentinus lepideus HHB14362 ss-1 TaxID=1314782 RepID=A0A165VBV7_9AGAM|nr:hypothetical protein NEOLEDRAFT_1128211 [Neolentinus lepideus HHB14362 ss-1]
MPARPNLRKWTACLDRVSRKLNLSPHLRDIRLANVLSGKTCTPIGLADFEAYLAYVEYSLENLLFVVWYQNYRDRFFSLPAHEQARSQGSSAAHFPFSPPSYARTEQCLAQSKRHATVSSARSTLTYSSEMHILKPSTSVDGLPVPERSATLSSYAVPLSTSPSLSGVVAVGSDPGTQPFRDEVAKAVATFLRPGSEKELSLDSRLRDAVISDLMWNTHPDVLLPIYEEIYNTLETVSLPRFLAYASTNINLPRQIFWYAIGLIDFLLGLALAFALITTLPVPTQANRAWRLFSVPLTALGAMQMYSAWRGFCSQIWRRGKMQVRPWELTAASDAEQQEKGVIAPFADEDEGQTEARERSIPVFGPERVVLDPRIAEAHKRVMRDIYACGVWFSLGYAVIILSVPSAVRH